MLGAGLPSPLLQGRGKEAREGPRGSRKRRSGGVGGRGTSDLQSVVCSGQTVGRPSRLEKSTSVGRNKAANQKHRPGSGCDAAGGRAGGEDAVRGGLKGRLDLKGVAVGRSPRWQQLQKKKAVCSGRLAIDGGDDGGRGPEQDFGAGRLLAEFVNKWKNVETNNTREQGGVPRGGKEARGEGNHRQGYKGSMPAGTGDGCQSAPPGRLWLRSPPGCFPAGELKTHVCRI
ncbi:hypothetical protein B0T11DRAFT_348563 [Plectosphaerella cucumerina]|uniref:Uncharacterized protein n=1 Tax=Plectosphaerella cucumerina TaxID=40658 RepID=A0A8K0TJ23_9PEZI|nr:hypothetical protein B0T11DRAFT_348563 [Plectosphaerella cucumerina]